MIKGTSDLDTAAAIKAFAAARVSLGVALFVAPSRLGRLWLGALVKDNPAAVAAVRSMGARDALLGAGALIALREKAPVRGWLEAAAGADAADVVSSLAAGSGLPVAARIVVPIFGVVGAIVGLQLARRAGEAVA